MVVSKCLVYSSFNGMMGWNHQPYVSHPFVAGCPQEYLSTTLHSSLWEGLDSTQWSPGGHQRGWRPGLHRSWSQKCFCEGHQRFVLGQHPSAVLRYWGFFWQLFTLVGALLFKDDQHDFFILCIYRSRAPPRNRINQDKKPLPVDIWQSLIDAKVEQFCSDAALDEQVCSELLQHEFKGLKVRAKDVTHATRRTPWVYLIKKIIGYQLIMTKWSYHVKFCSMGCSKLWCSIGCFPCFSGPWQDPIKSNISWSIPAEHTAHVRFQQELSCPTHSIPGLLRGEVCKVCAGVKGLAMWLSRQPKSKFSDSNGVLPKMMNSIGLWLWKHI